MAYETKTYMKYLWKRCVLIIPIRYKTRGRYQGVTVKVWRKLEGMEVPKFRWGDPKRRTWARSPGVTWLYEGLYWTCGQFPVGIQSRPQYFATSILLINFFGFEISTISSRTTVVGLRYVVCPETGKQKYWSQLPHSKGKYPLLSGRRRSRHRSQIVVNDTLGDSGDSALSKYVSVLQRVAFLIPLLIIWTTSSRHIPNNKIFNWNFL